MILGLGAAVEMIFWRVRHTMKRMIWIASFDGIVVELDEVDGPGRSAQKLNVSRVNKISCVSKGMRQSKANPCAFSAGGRPRARTI